MKSKKVCIGIVYLFLHFLLILNSAHTQKPTQTIYPLKDAFVRSTTPNDNSGDWEFLAISEDHILPGSDISYLHFELPTGYDDYNRIYIHIFGYLMWINTPLHVDFYRVTQSWNESTITWNNMPALDEFLFSMQVAHSRMYNINVKSHVTSDNFSFCIKASFAQDNSLTIESKESVWAEDDEFPALILQDITTNNLPIIIGITVGSIIAVGVGGGLGYFYFHKKRSRKNLT